MQDTATGCACADDVVLTGLSGRLPESGSIEEFAQQLFGGVDMVTADGRRWMPGLYGLPERNGKLKDLTHFDAMYFGVHAKQANVMDPQVRLLLELTHEVLVDAGLNPTTLRGSRTGVFVGVSASETEHMTDTDVEKINGYVLTGCCRALFANRISYTFDLKGPSIAVDTACSSTLSALTQAVNAIRTGVCDAAVVAGSNICLNPNTSVNFQKLSMLSPEGRCAAFDASGGGYVRSEAAVAVLLQRHRDARRVYCTVRGARMNTDGYKEEGITYPAGDMQRRLALETYHEAGLDPKDVAYVEAHGTGTKVGDPEEVNAIAEVFCKGRQAPVLMGSVKSNMGHAETASGLCSIAKIVLAMERGIIPGNLHFENPNPDIPALNDGRIKVVNKNTPWQGGLVALNSFGFGGANAHVILESHGGPRPPPAEYPVPRLILASGRTDEAVEKLLSLAVEHQGDAELHALLDEVHARAILRHPWRGYAVLDPAGEAAPVTEVLESEVPRPVWFVFSGMGSQWAGMGRELLRLPTFAASVARSAAVVAPYDVDLLDLISEAPEEAFDDVINCFVSITAVQVAMVDVLRELGVHPDGIVGHSLGEVACAYADGCLTAEQTVLCAYWRGRCTLDAAPAPGKMAAVGLGWEEAARRCPKGIELACHNSADNVTIAGPQASVEKFVEQLSAEGVFVKVVETAGVAFHSSLVAAAAPLLLARLRGVIPDPAPRSARWLSTSVPTEQWDSELAKLCDAAYLVNNMVSPVRFAAQLARLPARALVAEVAPHALLQALLTRALPAARHAPLARRGAPDARAHLLAAVGKIYTAGSQPQVSQLYPRVSWPVSRGTPSLSSHIGWDHSTTWHVSEFAMRQVAEHVFEYDISKPEEAFLTGHSIDGRILFPATGYIMLAWRAIAKMHNLEIENAAVVIENVELRRATIVSADTPLRFHVTVMAATGDFEIRESDVAVATGTARLVDDASVERMPIDPDNANETYSFEDLPLDSEDIYKNLWLRGYNYKGQFRGIISSDSCGSRGLLKWEGNWISFMDTVLQFLLIGVDLRDLHLPTRIRRVVIDPASQREVAAASEGALPIQRHSYIDSVASGGIEFQGIATSQAQRRNNVQAQPKLEKYVLFPYFGSDDKITERDALTAAIQMFLQNCGAQLVRVTEAALGRPVEELLLPVALQVLETEPGLRATASLAAGDRAPEYAAAMEQLGVKVSNKGAPLGELESDSHVVLCAGALGREVATLCALAAATCAGGFVLLAEPARAHEEPAAQDLLTAAGLTLVSCTRSTSRDYLLLRRAAVVPETNTVIEARDDEYTWVEPLRLALKRAETEDSRVYVWSCARDSGVQGLAACLRREPGGARLRSYHLPGARAFHPAAPAYRAQVQRDLAFNVLRDGAWGTFLHLLLEDTSEDQIQVEHAYVNTLTRGDLSSLRWIESDLRHAAVTQRAGTDLCRVYCAPLNFRDVMLATGRLRLDALAGDLATRECVLGYECSGRSSTGKRVMGIVPEKGLATTVLADKGCMWEVPPQWSLEEAATIPVAYTTVYYALVVRGRMLRGESVLIHAGAGAVGQAAIRVALHAGCTVFTTVGSPEKRAFLLNRFPELSDENIGNSRDCSFEELVLRRTRGRGVDLLLNSLAGDKLQASLRCLANGGRFLEIGKLDPSNNTPLGMAVLLKNVTVHGVFLDSLLDEDNNHPVKVEVLRCVSEGIASGVVRPLPTTVYSHDQLEEAFRYMATGKHIGKVIIRVREEEAGGAPAPAPRLLPAAPRLYMHPGKSYVLVGGLGGFGLELAEWLVTRGARALVLNSRSGVRTGYQAWCLRRWRRAGVRVLVSTADATTASGARALLLEAAAMAPVGGIFNLAVVLHDALLENQTPDTFSMVTKPKIDATRELDIASRKLAPELDHFVAFSSVTCGRGNPGQSNYGFANSAMERLCERRRAEGRPALAVQWGAVGDVGVLAHTHTEDTEVSGTVPQRIASCLATLGLLLAQPHAVVSSFVLADKRRAQGAPAQGLVQAVANILGITNSIKVSETATLAEMGMDSLMSAEIKQTLERQYDLLLSIQEIRALTFSKLREMGGETTNDGHERDANDALSADNNADCADNDDISAVNGNTDRDSSNPNDDQIEVAFRGLVPQQVLVKLPSLQPTNPDSKPVFMVHPIEGVVDSLRGIAARVRGAVYGLQCASSAPLDNMAALARFYVARMRTAQPHPPYTLLGYSFGAAVVFEMALQLQEQGCASRLVLVDGSPTVISAFIWIGTKNRAMPTLETNEVDLLSYVGQVFFNLEPTKVATELRPLRSWEARVRHLTALGVASGAGAVQEAAVSDAARLLYRRLVVGDAYKPSARLDAPVTLFNARRSRAPLPEDLGLRAMCAGVLRVRPLPATHLSIVTGDAARVIADHVSELLANTN